MQKVIEFTRKPAKKPAKKPVCVALEKAFTASCSLRGPNADLLFQLVVEARSRRETAVFVEAAFFSDPAVAPHLDSAHPRSMAIRAAYLSGEL